MLEYSQQPQWEAYAGGDDGRHSSETDTEQTQAKELGSDASTNVNCGDQDINSASDIDAQVCGTLDVGGPGWSACTTRLATTL